MTTDFTQQPMVSVVIPVLHEGRAVRNTLERIKNSTYPGEVEIIVVDGDPGQSTIRYIDTSDVVACCSDPGRAKQMNTGARKAKGRILVFLHCDTQLPEKGVHTIAKILEANRYDMGAFDLSIDAKGFGFRMIEKTASLRSRLTRIPYGDQAFFMTREFFFKMGGFWEVPLMEDVEFMQRVKKKGGRLFITSHKVKTSARRWQKEGKVLGTLRNWAIMALYLFGVPPEKLARAYKNNRERQA